MNYKNKRKNKFFMLICTFLVFIITIPTVYINVRASANSFEVTAENVGEIQANINRSDIDTIIFTENVTISTNGYTVNSKNIKFVVNDGVTVNFEAASTGRNGFRVILGNEQTFKVENNGIINFKNFGRAFWVSGNESSRFEIVGDGKENNELNIINNSGYAIAAMDNYSGFSLFEGIKLTTNSTANNLESAVYLGNRQSATVQIIDSKLDLVNNSTAYTSGAFVSNAKQVDIRNSEVKATSKAHYNLNTYNMGGSPEPQRVNIDNSTIEIVSPEDSNPHRLVGGFFVLPLSLVGINSADTIFNVSNGSKITHDNNWNGSDVSTIELSYSQLVVDNSTVEVSKIGFDDDGASAHNKLGIEINGNSKVTIPAFNGNPETNGFDKIIINGGSVELPTKVENGKTVFDLPNNVVPKNKNGEELTNFIIPKDNFDNGSKLTISKNSENQAVYPEYIYGFDKNNVHGDNVSIWAPKVSLTFYENEEKANQAGGDSLLSTELPRGANANLLSVIAPQINGENVRKWLYAGTQNEFTMTDSILKNTSVVAVVDLKVTFDENYEGKPGNKVVNVENNKAIGSDNLTTQNFPVTPTRNEKDGVEFVFAGWNTKMDGSGETFTENTVVSKNITVYAQWKKKIPATEIVPAIIKNVPDTSDSSFTSLNLLLVLATSLILMNRFVAYNKK